MCKFHTITYNINYIMFSRCTFVSFYRLLWWDVHLCHLTGCYDEMQPAFDRPKQQAMQRRWETAECCTRYWKERIHCWHENPSSCKGSTDQRYISNWFYLMFVYSTIKMNCLSCYRKKYQLNMKLQYLEMFEFCYIFFWGVFLCFEPCYFVCSIL